MNLTSNWRTKTAIALGAVLLASTAALAAGNADFKIGFTPKFLKDDF